MLGAKGVQMGTHFVATEECWAHQNYKDMILKAKDIDTKVTGRSTGHPVRALRNQMTQEYLKKEAEGVPFEELEQMTLGSLRRGRRCENGKRYGRPERWSCERAVKLS